MRIIGEDNQEEIKQINPKKVLIAGIVVIILIITIVLTIVYALNKQFRDFMDKYVLMKNVMENNVNSISIADTPINAIYAYDKYISILNQNKLVGYNISGKKEYELAVEITNPIIDTNGRFLLIGEAEKQKIYLISADIIQWEKELEGNISRVSVNKNGYVSVVLTGTTYKSIIQTFDSSGKEMFTTYLSNIAVDSDISNDNKFLSFAEISTNATLVQSMIKTISIQKTQEPTEESKINNVTQPTNNVILNLKYEDGNRLICMYNDSIHILQNGTDEEIFSLEEKDKKIVFADTELNNYIYRIYENSSLLKTQSTVEIMNVSNKKMNIYELNSVIKEVYSYNGTIALNLGSEVHFIGTNGWLSKKYISTQEVRKIVIANNFAGIVYRDKIELIEL